MIGNKAFLKQLFMCIIIILQTIQKKLQKQMVQLSGMNTNKEKEMSFGECFEKLMQNPILW